MIVVVTAGAAELDRATLWIALKRRVLALAVLTLQLRSSVDVLGLMKLNPRECSRAGRPRSEGVVLCKLASRSMFV